jgi:hypothetical protein
VRPGGASPTSWSWSWSFDRAELVVYCARCGEAVASIADYEYAAGDLPLREDLPGSEGISDSVRTMPRRGSHPADWLAHSIIYEALCNLVHDDDFRVNVYKHQAFAVLYRAAKHVVGVEEE